MKIEIYRELFIDELSKYFDNTMFSGYAKYLLFNYFEDLEKELNEEICINFVGVCCEWSEDKINSVLDSYNLDSIEELKQFTTVIKTYYLDENEYVLYKKF